MTLLSEQVQRIQWLLQDTRTDATTISKVSTAHQEAMQTLVRQNAFTQLLWVQGIENQALYTLPTNTVNVFHVLYNQRVLHYVTEKTLDRYFHAWESMKGEPEYWTMDNQPPNVMRLIPAPVRTGSDVPVFSSPLPMDLIDNLLIFISEDGSEGLLEESDTLPTLLDWDDLLVYKTVKMLAERETPEQNLPVSMLCGQLDALWSKFINER